MNLSLSSISLSSPVFVRSLICPYQLRPKYISCIVDPDFGSHTRTDGQTKVFQKILTDLKKKTCRRVEWSWLPPKPRINKFHSSLFCSSLLNSTLAAFTPGIPLTFNTCRAFKGSTTFSLNIMSKKFPFTIIFQTRPWPAFGRRA